MDTLLEQDQELAAIANLRGGPGILILSPDSQLLHMNRRGWELIRQINAEHAVKDAGGLLPLQVTQICAEIHRLLLGEAASKDWEQLEIRRIAGGPKTPVLLRGFALPSSQAVNQARVLILMESVGRRQMTTQQAQKRFQFTDREKSVVENLAKGLTNKEIAAELGITEPTVKAHIKHIMDKTKCTTRTAIVAQLLHS
jgi:DNA-binding CsgD family transcriptional regulator